MKKLLTGVTALVGLAALSACNSVPGFVVSAGSTTTSVTGGAADVVGTLLTGANSLVQNAVTDINGVVRLVMPGASSFHLP